MFWRFCWLLLIATTFGCGKKEEAARKNLSSQTQQQMQKLSIARSDRIKPAGYTGDHRTPSKPSPKMS